MQYTTISPDDDSELLLIYPRLLVVFSHLRWDFVYQRPQHLLTRLSKNSKICFIEEPVFDARETSYYQVTDKSTDIQVLVPHIMPGLSHQHIMSEQQKLLFGLLADQDMAVTGFWYYTPMALQFSRSFKPAVVIYDCMDELSAFKFAPSELVTLETELLQRATLVFTGGESLYKKKKGLHTDVYIFLDHSRRYQRGHCSHCNIPGVQC